MQQYLAKVKELVGEFEECTMEYILRQQNTRADLLLKLASTRIVANSRSVIREVVDDVSSNALQKTLHCVNYFEF